MFAVGSEPNYIEVTVKQEPVETQCTEDDEEDTKSDKAKCIKRQDDIKNNECNDNRLPTNPWTSLAVVSKRNFIEVTIKEEPVQSQFTEDNEVEKIISINNLKCEIEEEFTDKAELGNGDNSESGVSTDRRDLKNGELDGAGDIGSERSRDKQGVDVVLQDVNIKRKQIIDEEDTKCDELDAERNECNVVAPTKKRKRTHMETQDRTTEQNIQEITNPEAPDTNTTTTKNNTKTSTRQVSKNTSIWSNTNGGKVGLDDDDDYTSTRPFLCSICQKRFKISSHLNSHLRTHTGEKPFECTTCYVRFNQSGQLNRHMKIHTGEKPYECDTCHQRFSCSGNLKTHSRIHTGEKPFECETCHRRFNESGQLSRHLRIHTGEKPFECEICHRRFNVGSHLKAHFRIHTGEKPFECEVCHRRFMRSSDLKKHLRVHTGEKPYECAKCSRRFTNSSHLTVHMKTHILDNK